MTHYDSSVNIQKCMLVVNVYGGVWYVALYRTPPTLQRPHITTEVHVGCERVWVVPQTLRSTERTTCSGSSHNNRPIHTRF